MRKFLIGAAIALPLSLVIVPASALPGAKHGAAIGEALSSDIDRSEARRPWRRQRLGPLARLQAARLEPRTQGRLARHGLPSGTLEEGLVLRHALRTQNRHAAMRMPVSIERRRDASAINLKNISQTTASAMITATVLITSTLRTDGPGSA